MLNMVQKSSSRALSGEVYQGIVSLAHECGYLVEQHQYKESTDLSIASTAGHVVIKAANLVQLRSDVTALQRMLPHVRSVDAPTRQQQQRDLEYGIATCVSVINHQELLCQLATANLPGQALAIEVDSQRDALHIFQGAATDVATLLEADNRIQWLKRFDLDNGCWTKQLTQLPTAVRSLTESVRRLERDRQVVQAMVSSLTPDAQEP